MILPHGKTPGTYRDNGLQCGHTNRSLLGAILSEMVKIGDETLVKYKVEQIIQQLYPEFTLDYMKKRWNLNGL